MRKPVFGGFPTWSDTNQAVQPQKMARGLKFRISVVEELYYPYSENKGADQLRGHREADLRLCFCICKKPVFSRRGSYNRLLLSYKVVSEKVIKSCIKLCNPLVDKVCKLQRYWPVTLCNYVLMILCLLMMENAYFTEKQQTGI